MSIVKNEIPLLEFDNAQAAVLDPTHDNLGLELPKKCVFARRPWAQRLRRRSWTG